MDDIHITKKRYSTEVELLLRWAALETFGKALNMAREKLGGEATPLGLSPFIIRAIIKEMEELVELGHRVPEDDDDHMMKQVRFNLDSYRDTIIPGLKESLSRLSDDIQKAIDGGSLETFIKVPTKGETHADPHAGSLPMLKKLAESA